MSVENLRFDHEDRTYWWSGCYGAIIRSTERGVQQGDLRNIDGVEFYATTVCKVMWPFRCIVNWIVPDTNIERINELRQQFFGMR